MAADNEQARESEPKARVFMSYLPLLLHWLRRGGWLCSVPVLRMIEPSRQPFALRLSASYIRGGCHDPPDHSPRRPKFEFGKLRFPRRGSSFLKLSHPLGTWGRMTRMLPIEAAA